LISLPFWNSGRNTRIAIHWAWVGTWMLFRNSPVLSLEWPCQGYQYWAICVMLHPVKYSLVLIKRGLSYNMDVEAEMLFSFVSLHSWWPRVVLIYKTEYFIMTTNDFVRCFMKEAEDGDLILSICHCIKLWLYNKTLCISNFYYHQSNQYLSQ
jgi:hypothetical protein